MRKQWNEEEEEEEEGGLEEEELEEDDCFFESLDRVPSGVSFDVDIPSSGSDDEDDVRVSFASAVAPPSFRRISLSDDDHEDDEKRGDGGYDYGIWMAEPISIKERRRRLLQGMGLTSTKDLAAAGTRSRRMTLNPSRSRLSSRFVADEPPAPSPQQPSPPVITRSRSDSHLVGVRGPASYPYPVLFRVSSAPPSLWDRLGSHRRRWAMNREDFEGGENGRGGADCADTLSPGLGLGLCKIKNLDTGNEFVVSEFGKDGTWGRLNDLQTGLQLTMEEFERCLGFSPIVKELMRRVNLGGGEGDKKSICRTTAKSSKSSSSGRKKGGWLKNIKFVASSVTGLISEKERDCGSATMGRSSGGSTSTSTTSSSSEWMKVHQHGKSYKELTGLYMCQEIQAHQGSIWSIKFSSDSRYLASAGEDRVVHVWQVLECDSLRQHDPHYPVANGSALLATQLSSKRTKKGKASSGGSTRSYVPDYIVMPETVFSLSDKPVYSFQGHLDDVLDLSWSKSQVLHALIFEAYINPFYVLL